MNEYDEPVTVDNNEYETVIFEDYKIKFLNEDSDYDSEIEHSSLPDQWISDNQDMLFDLYKEIKSISQLNSIFEQLEYSDVCDYFDYTQHCTEYDYYDFNNPWNDSVPYKKGKLLTFKQFCSYHYSTLMSLYNYIDSMYPVKVGTFEGFMEFAYIYSRHKIYN